MSTISTTIDESNRQFVIFGDEDEFVSNLGDHQASSAHVSAAERTAVLVCMAPAAAREQGSPPAVLSEPPQLFVEEGFPKEREREREREDATCAASRAKQYSAA